MKKYKCLFIIFSFISVIALTVFLSFAFFQLKNVMTNKFGISNNYYEIDVIDLGMASKSDNKEILDKIRKFALNNDILIIFDSIDSMGLGVYDSKLVYTDGTYNFKKDFYLNDLYADYCNIYVKKNSYIHNNSKLNDDTYNIGNKKLKVIGYYDEKCDLFTNEKSFIYPLLSQYSDSLLSGKYYLITDESSMSYDFIKIFDKKYHSQLTLNDVSSNIIFNVIEIFSSNKMLLIMLIGSILIYFNLFLFYKFILFSSENEISIFFRFGATKNKILKSYLKVAVSRILLGSFAGEIFYYYIFRSGNLKITISSMILFIFLNTLLSVFTYIFAVLTSKMYVKRKQYRRVK